jgi:hypothetical protein
MTTTFTTPKPTYQPKVVADIEFPALAWLNTETADRRRLRDGKIDVRLPTPIMTDYGKGPRRPGVSELGKIRMIGALLTVTIEDDRLTGTGILYKTLPDTVDFWPAIDLDNISLKGYKNGRIDVLGWRLAAVTLHDYPPAWPDLPRATITGK